MEWGTKSRLELLEKMEASGREPEALQTRPDVPEYLAFYMESFYKLSNMRTIGFSGVNPISFSDVKAYIDLYPCDVELFLHLITEMDAQYLEIRNKPRGG